VEICSGLVALLEDRELGDSEGLYGDEIAGVRSLTKSSPGN
jgi:hypothetical protein